GKVFLLCVSESTNSYEFYWAHATGSPLNWQRLALPPRPIAPQPDAALAYFYNPLIFPPEEKVLAVFGGGREVWAFNVPTQEWFLDMPIWGDDPIGEGGSLKFGGFMTVFGQPVTRFYLIKGGGSKDFMAYNRLYGGMRVRVPFPYWEFLRPFYISEDSAFYAGADLAMWPSVPYLTLSPYGIYAMRGGGKDFGFYFIPGNWWDRRHNILGDGAFLGGALVSHDTWGDLLPEGPNNEENEEDFCILHCFRGEDEDGQPTKEFDCYDYPDLWNADHNDPIYYVSSGSDLAYGAYWGLPNDSTCGIWASFGNYCNRIGFYGAWRPLQGGSQSLFSAAEKRLLVSPNPAKGKVTFQLPAPYLNASLRIYTENGEVVRILPLENGRGIWDLSASDGKLVPPGVYFYTARTGAAEISGKLVISK
ncbi:MAG: T9SS type A sorting domain-containing protein, partial [candidate division WOR-3 bacterium]